MDQQVLEARQKLAERFGKTQVGGKGTQRRTKKVTHHQEVNEDKRLKSTVKKFGMQDLKDIEEVNMFKDDNTVLHFKKPQTSFSVKENLLVVAGNPESKGLSEVKGGKEDQKNAQEEDVPELIGTFEDAQKVEQDKNKPSKDQITKSIASNLEDINSKLELLMEKSTKT